MLASSALSVDLLVPCADAVQELVDRDLVAARNVVNRKVAHVHRTALR